MAGRIGYTSKMELESKIVWDDGEMPRFELFIAGASFGRFDTITEAADSLKGAFTAVIQSTCCDECASEYGIKWTRQLE